jgi:uncharacterized protein YeaO (DUF488 family)
MSIVIKIKRAYDKPLKTDGYRILIARLWPYNLSQEKAAIDEWAKEIAPTERLKIWYDYNRYHWDEFQNKYRQELKHNKAVDDFIAKIINKKMITLVYATKYDKLTPVLVTKQFLETVCCAV